ncbi:ATP-dependent helicase [Bradyrhizobium liaoningense]|uniref:ATP-dependent helicase n=1 Tax=Bradyrhizobium liaoningense TaxID=43992 RepID=UPI001BAA55B9|nr:UvrD-helicase domain-containing protein [Bradyrhizobium liaoningense]MBR0905542.1 UvrD-helicase domain-containing protein [Bradyrhizobium liaoningense]
MTEDTPNSRDAGLPLNAAQREAVAWGDGAALVLAGPGSGKTAVLTTRIASLLKGSPKERFRVLALTFTNAAAAEMGDRVKALLGAEDDRSFIGTFHAFCINVLQSHGAHIGVNSSFRIFNLEADREAVLATALRELGQDGLYDNKRVLAAIDRLRGRLVPSRDAARYFKDPDHGAFVARAYAGYENALTEAQALDFPGLLMEAWRLFHEVPVVAARYRKTFRYWLVDEFQDTNRAQYGLLRELAGDQFRNLFVVADDDQIIYRWNGASYQQLERFRSDFLPVEIQLPTNYRCSSQVVEAANNLIRHNSERTPSKADLVPGKVKTNVDPTIEVNHFRTDDEERLGIAEAISASPLSERSNIVVLARSKYLLDGVLKALMTLNVEAKVVSRRDDFVSAAYVWMQAVLRQLVRPQDTSNLEVLASSFGKLGGREVAVEVLNDAQVETGKSLLKSWVETQALCSPQLVPLVEATDELVNDPKSWRAFVQRCGVLWSAVYGGDQLPSDVLEDRDAWKELSKEINQAIGKTASLDEFLHRLDISSKEPNPGPSCVRLMTIHGAKGKEFKTVYLLGLAEGELPSWQSLKPGATAELEEERRACFVAITRTEDHLVLSYSDQYRNWSKKPSRFLTEMGLLS